MIQSKMLELLLLSAILTQGCSSSSSTSVSKDLVNQALPFEVNAPTAPAPELENWPQMPDCGGVVDQMRQDFRFDVAAIDIIPALGHDYVPAESEGPSPAESNPRSSCALRLHFAAYDQLIGFISTRAAAQRMPNLFYYKKGDKIFSFHFVALSVDAVDAPPEFVMAAGTESPCRQMVNDWFVGPNLHWGMTPDIWSTYIREFSLFGGSGGDVGHSCAVRLSFKDVVHYLQFLQYRLQSGLPLTGDPFVIADRLYTFPHMVEFTGGIGSTNGTTISN